MIGLIISNQEVKIEWVQFSDGARTCKIIDLPENPTNISISVNTRTSVSDIREEVNLVLSALHENYHGLESHVSLMLPYLPHARADRVFETGNAHPLSMFLEWLKKCDFDKIFIDDIHNSEYISDCYHELPIEETKQFDIALPIVNKIKPDYILAPDKGSVYKAGKLSLLSLNIPLLTADKIRDISTGKILSIKLNKLPKPNSTVFIVDDILDGGGTFIPLAKELKSHGCKVILFVTHLIGSKGLDILKDIDKIYTRNHIGKYVSSKDLIEFNEKAK
jgi:ribose-phosphate pyrophosphokinase